MGKHIIHVDKQAISTITSLSLKTYRGFTSSCIYISSYVGIRVRSTVFLFWESEYGRFFDLIVGSTMSEGKNIQLMICFSKVLTYLFIYQWDLYCKNVQVQMITLIIDSFGVLYLLKLNWIMGLAYTVPVLTLTTRRSCRKSLVWYRVRVMKMLNYIFEYLMHSTNFERQ